MSGLDKIVAQIQEEAKASAAEILNEAKAKAEEIAKEAGSAREKSAKASKEAVDFAREDILRKSRSAAQMQRRRELLLTKQQLIDEIIGEAQKAMLALKPAEYFAALEKMLNKHAQPLKGEVRLSKKDLDRLPAGFEKTVAKAAKAKGGELVLSNCPADIDGGFLLIYGDIEENCSFSALILSEKENLQDKLHTFLFV